MSHINHEYYHKASSEFQPALRDSNTTIDRNIPNHSPIRQPHTLISSDVSFDIDTGKLLFHVWNKNHAIS